MSTRCRARGTLLSDTVTPLSSRDLRHAPRSCSSRPRRAQWPAKLWQGVEEGGLTLPQIPEDAGGAGGTWQDAYVVVRAAGRTRRRCRSPRRWSPPGSSPRRGSTCRSGRSRWRRCTRASGCARAATADRLAAQRHGHARAVGRAPPATSSSWPGGRRLMVALVAARAPARPRADRNLALEPRDTLAFERCAGRRRRAGRRAGRRRRRVALRRARPRGPDGGRRSSTLLAQIGAVRERAQAVRPAHRRASRPSSTTWRSSPATRRPPGIAAEQRVPRRRSGRRRASRSRWPRCAPARRPASAPASRTSPTGRSASPTSTRSTSPRAGSGRGAPSSVARAAGPSGSGARWPRAGPTICGVSSPRAEGALVSRRKS